VNGRAVLCLGALAAAASAAQAHLSVFPANPAVFQEVAVTVESDAGSPGPCFAWALGDRRLHTIEIVGTGLPLPVCTAPVPQVELGFLEVGHYVVTAHLAGSTEIVGEVHFDVQALPSAPTHLLDLGFSNPSPRAGEPFAVTFSVAHLTCEAPQFDSPAQVVGDAVVIDGSLGFCGILPIPIWQVDGFRFTVPGLTAGTKTLVIRDGGTTVKTYTFQVDADSTSLASFGGVFETSVRWTDRAGAPHDAIATRLSDTSGQFWFFDPNNPEVTVKLVDGSAYNAAIWVFASSLTDLGFTVTVRSSLCEPGGCVRERTYTQLPGHNRNFIDTSAFPNCPNCSP